HISARWTRSEGCRSSTLVAAAWLHGLRVVGKEILLLHQPLKRISVQVAMKVGRPLRPDARRLVVMGARALAEIALPDVDRDPAPLRIDLRVYVVAVLPGGDVRRQTEDFERVLVAARATPNAGRAPCRCRRHRGSPSAVRQVVEVVRGPGIRVGS